MLEDNDKDLRRNEGIDSEIVWYEMEISKNYYDRPSLGNGYLF